MVKSKILVTGATGTVGMLLLKELADKGEQVRACIHTNEDARVMEWTNVELVEVDYNDGETLSAATRGIERLYLLTPFVPEQLEYARRIVDAAEAAGVGYIVKQSGLGAGSAPSAPPRRPGGQGQEAGLSAGRLHQRAEEYIEASGVPYTFIRPNFFMQNFLNYFGAAIKGEARISLPLGVEKVSYIDAHDVARVAAEVLTGTGHAGRTYTLTGPEALSLYEVARIFTHVTGRSIIYVNVAEEIARGAMLSAGMHVWTVDAMTELYRMCRDGLAAEVTNDVETVTGTKAGTLEKFAADNLNFFVPTPAA